MSAIVLVSRAASAPGLRRAPSGPGTDATRLTERRRADNNRRPAHVALSLRDRRAERFTDVVGQLGFPVAERQGDVDAAKQSHRPSTHRPASLTRSVSLEVALFCFQPQRGDDKPAQGNALGWRFPITHSPERAALLIGTKWCRPFRASKSVTDTNPGRRSRWSLALG